MQGSGSTSSSPGQVTRENINNLVPITREVLRKYYEGFPVIPPAEETVALRKELEEHCRNFGLDLNYVTDNDDETNASSSSSSEGSSSPSCSGPLSERLTGNVQRHPHKLDENVWRSRQQLEEMLYLLDPERLNKANEKLKSSGVSTEEWNRAVEDIKSSASSAFDRLQAFQKGGLRKVAELIATFLPNDFRMSIVRSQQERSEAKREAMIQALVDRGGSIKDKYDLHWKLQLERRQTLVNIGNATGAYKAVIKYIGGVPQVLLDFIKTVNDNHGPMDELRCKYGPKLYFLCEFINAARLLLDIVYLSLSEKDDAEDLSTARKTLLADGKLLDEMKLLVRAAQAYDREIEIYLKQQLEILQGSPFFVSKSVVAGMMDDSSEEEKEVVVAKVHDIRIKASPGDEIVWEFSTKGKDIEFAVFFEKQSGEGQESVTVETIKAKERVDSHVDRIGGMHISQSVGVYRLVWDNSYSWLAKKTLVYKAFRRGAEEATASADSGDGDEEDFEGAVAEIAAADDKDIDDAAAS